MIGAVGTEAITEKEAEQTGRFDPRIEEKIDRLVDRLMENPYARAVYLIQSGRAVLGENVVPNPDFESMEGRHPEYPEHLGWQPSEADYWAFWEPFSPMGEVGVSGVKSQAGERSGWLRGTNGSCLVAWIPEIDPEEHYYIGANVFLKAGPDDRAEAAVVLRWLDSEAQWIRGLDARLDQTTQALGEWVRLQAIAEPPSGAVSAVILLAAENLHDDGEVFFDQIKLQTIRED